MKKNISKTLAVFALVCTFAFGLAACGTNGGLTAKEVIGVYETSQVVYTPAGAEEQDPITRTAWGEMPSGDQKTRLGMFFCVYEATEDGKVLDLEEENEANQQIATWKMKKGKLDVKMIAEQGEAYDVVWDDGKIIITLTYTHPENADHNFVAVMTLEKRVEEEA